MIEIAIEFQAEIFSTWKRIGSIMFWSLFSSFKVCAYFWNALHHHPIDSADNKTRESQNKKRTKNKKTTRTQSCTWF